MAQRRSHLRRRLEPEGQHREARSGAGRDRSARSRSPSAGSWPRRHGRRSGQAQVLATVKPPRPANGGRTSCQGRAGRKLARSDASCVTSSPNPCSPAPTTSGPRSSLADRCALASAHLSRSSEGAPAVACNQRRQTCAANHCTQIAPPRNSSAHFRGGPGEQGQGLDREELRRCGAPLSRSASRMS